MHIQAMFLDNQLTWRDATSVRVKLKVPITKRHNCERAARCCWLSISQVWFLYDLPTYFRNESAVYNRNERSVIDNGNGW
jgi:hypothetical protein